MSVVIKKKFIAPKNKKKRVPSMDDALGHRCITNTHLSHNRHIQITSHHDDTKIEKLIDDKKKIYFRGVIDNEARAILLVVLLLLKTNYHTRTMELCTLLLINSSISDSGDSGDSGNNNYSKYAFGKCISI